MGEAPRTGPWEPLCAPLRGLGAGLPGRLATASDAPSDDGTRQFTAEMSGVPEEATKHRVRESVTTPTRDKTRRNRQCETRVISERDDGAFRRSFRLPPVTAAEAASARIMDGVFQVAPRRAENALRGQRIAVDRGQAIPDGDPRPVLPESGSCHP